MKINKKYTSLLLLVTVIFISSSFNVFPQKENTKIYWSPEAKLTWSDFQGEVPANDGHSAISELGMESGYAFNNNVLEIDVKSYFEKTLSWDKKNDQAEDLLKHEQTHFDIAEIYARKLRKELINSKFNSKNIQSKFDESFQKVNSEYKKYQVLYDKETDHHRNKEKQVEWNAKIAKELKELDQYNETHIVIKMK